MKNLMRAALFGASTAVVGLALWYGAKQMFGREAMKSMQYCALVLFILGLVMYALKNHLDNLVR